MLSSKYLLVKVLSGAESFSQLNLLKGDLLNIWVQLSHLNTSHKINKGGLAILSTVWSVAVKSWLVCWSGPSGMRNFIPVRYGTVFLLNSGIPVFFGTVWALYFHTGICWKLFGIFRYFFIGAISDQFRIFLQLLKLLYIRKLPKKHFFFLTIKS